MLLANEGTHLGEAGGDARRLLLARFVLEHRLSEARPTNLAGFAREDAAIPLLLDDAPMPLDQAAALAVQ